MKLFTRIITIMCLLSLSVFSARAQSANFTADYVAGCAPLVVHFTNTSTGASSYFWDLGNTTTTAVTNPSTSYILPGTYTVKLTAYNGSSSSIRTITITVYPLPTVNFAANDTVVCPGVPVTFTSSSVGGVTGPLTYAWNFGDGSAGSGNPAVHPYGAAGNYNVTLSVINAQGCVNSLTRPTYIDVFPKPIANFGGSPANSCMAPVNVSFNNTSSGSGPMIYAWWFGDGGFSTLGSPGHTYTAPGSYTVRLRITDVNGCVDSMTRPAYINISNLTASFTAPSTACIGTSVLFNSTSGAIVSASWDFGDGSGASTASAGHVYTTAGTYNVRLIVYNGYCYDTVVHPITISPSPLSSYNINPVHPCPAPVTQSFNATVSPGATVAWSFGDGATGTGASTNHTYTTNGVKTVKLVVTSPAGCKDSVTKSDTIYDLIPIVTDTPNSGCVPLTVSFSALAYTSVPSPPLHLYPYGVASYSWNFGDGSPIDNTPAPVHIYTAVGVYTAILNMVTANGCPASDTVTIYVGSPPTVTYTATPTHICANKDVSFTATHTGPVTVYVWDFGDGMTSSDSTGNTIHNYHVPGVYSPTLTAYYNGCPSIPFVRVDYITVDSPMADFTYNFLCVPPTSVQFTNLSLGVNTYTWIFGDGATTSSVWSPSHNYLSLSSYTVQLATYNIASGCRDTASQIINLSRPVPSFTADDTAVCQYDTVTFTPSVTGGSASGYSWWIDGAFVGSTVTDFSYEFGIRGWHTVMMIMTDTHGCFDTVIKNNYILVAKPIGNFTAAPTTVCAYSPVTFTDASTDVTGATITNYLWTFGDGATGSVTTPVTTHIYTAAGTYDVTEIAVDNIGCRDTLLRPTYIHVNKPTAAFTTTTTHPCKGVPLLFTNTSTGATTYSWSFGDGGTSTAMSPSHAYMANGIYSVKLIVTDAAGCTDTLNAPSYINVSGPTAGFTMSDSVSVCPPLFVTFTNTSSGGAVTYTWSFGDGNTSVLVAPSNMYITASSYTVTLVARDLYGCTDTAYGHAQIFGSAGGFSYTPLTGCAPLTVFFNANITNVPTVIWDFADGTISPPSSGTTTTHIYTIPGAYVPRLVLSDGTACQSSSPGLDTIKVDAVTVGFDLPPGMCEFGTFTLIDTSTSYWSTINSWYWTFNGDTSTQSSPTFTAGAAGTYTVTVTATDGWGCTGSVVRDVTIYPPPDIDAGPDTIICVGDAATLEATGGHSYVWADGATLSCTACNPTQASPPAETTYTVTGTDVHGCVNTDTVRVLLKTKTVSEALGGGEICSGQSLQLADTGATSFTWYPPNWLSDPHSGNPTATPLGSLTYTVVAQLAGCIPDTNIVSIIVHDVPTVDAGPNQTLVSGSTAILHATGTNIYKYSWADGATLSCDTCATTEAHMPTTTTYTVTVVNDFGCVATDTVTIYLYCDDKQVFVPNSFTPNGDGQNDVFYPRGGGLRNIKSFRIYNRWGQLLFERTNIDVNDESNAWDGSYGGMSPRPDVYVYIIEAICGTGQPIFIKGDVTIIR